MSNGISNQIVPLRLPVNGDHVVQIKRWVYRTADGRRTFCVYARTAVDALELLEHANLGVLLDPSGLQLESEKEGRTWEQSSLDSRIEGKRGDFHANRGGGTK